MEDASLGLGLNLNVNPLPLLHEIPADCLVEELNRMNMENKKLTQILSVVWEGYTSLQNHLKDLMTKNPNKEVTTPRKRKAECLDEICEIEVHENTESKREEIKTKISRVSVRTGADNTSLLIKDGYQWRKYGQKVTKDNPSPRAYFKCSFAPICSVKKKVQRSFEDRSILVATYEGEHNHPNPSQAELNLGSNQGLSIPCSASHDTSGSTITLDLTRPSVGHESKRSTYEAESPKLREFFVQQMTQSLTRDPSFTTSLAEAISEKILQHEICKNINFGS